MTMKAANQLGFAGALVTLAAASVIAYPVAAQANPGRDGARMYGDPTAAAPFWRRQHGLDCAEVAVADVVGELTGNQPSEDEVRALSENTPSSVRPGPIFQNGGTDNRDIPILLGHYGIATVMGLFTIGSLAPELGAGRKVIAGVNGETLWNQRGDRTHENHFVVVTGIDTGAGVVHLNDSGIDWGRDEVIPMAVFEASWATSNHFAVVAK
ncbi:C39 family peptidase [Mycobacterium sp. ML4]